MTKTAKKPVKGKKPLPKKKKAAGRAGDAKEKDKGNGDRKYLGPFVEGNQFWKLRAKHGRDRLFETPGLLLEAAEQYFQWCVDNPLIESVPFHAQGVVTMAKVPHMRPFTIQGITSYFSCNVQYFNDFEKSIAGKTDEISKGFSSVITYIRETIYNQKFTGAAVGFLNANIIARDLGLKDSSEVDLKTDILKKTVNDYFPEEGVKEHFNNGPKDTQKP